MQPGSSGATYGAAQLIERQMLFKHVRELTGDKKPTEEKSPCYRFLTISRRSGSMGDEVAQELAGHLGWRVYDREIVDQIAQSTHVTQASVQQLDEKSQNLVHDTVQRFLRLAEGGSFGNEEYHESLLKTLSVLATKGDAIIVGRGANFALSNEQRGLHVRIIASTEVCARRLSSAWEIPEGEAHRLLVNLEAERREFVRHHFRHDYDDLRFYDLVVSTDRMNVQQAAMAIWAAMTILPAEVRPPTESLHKSP